MTNVLKKGLLFLFILIIASLLFSNTAQKEQTSSHAEEVICLIENEKSPSQTSYAEEKVQTTKTNNFFVKVVTFLSNIILAIVNFFIRIVAKIFSSFAS